MPRTRTVFGSQGCLGSTVWRDESAILHLDGNGSPFVRSRRCARAAREARSQPGRYGSASGSSSRSGRRLPCCARPGRRRRSPRISLGRRADFRIRRRRAVGRRVRCASPPGRCKICRCNSACGYIADCACNGRYRLDCDRGTDDRQLERPASRQPVYRNDAAGPNTGRLAHPARSLVVAIGAEAAGKPLKRQPTHKAPIGGARF